MSLILNTISSTAFSFTLSGNSGISPFLTMLLIGITQRISPESFNMSETLEKIMSSWLGITFWGLMTVLELVGKCVPVVDQMVDSVEVFIVPWISTLGSAASFGSFDANDSDEGVPDNVAGENAAAEDVDGEKADGARYLTSSNYDSSDNGKVLRGRTLEATSSIAKGFQRFFQVILIFCGMFLALSLHFFKMFVRLLGEGCLTQLIAIGEALTVIFGVCISVFIRQFAIIIAAFLCLGAAHGAKKKYEKWHEEEAEEGADKSNTGRFKRFFNHKHKKGEEKGGVENEEQYIQMEEQPKKKKKHFWSKK